MGKTPKAPAPPPPAPPPPQVAQVTEDASVAAREEVDRYRRRRGRASTILVGRDQGGAAGAGSRALLG